jgi:hypothetical protein
VISGSVVDVLDAVDRDLPADLDVFHLDGPTSPPTLW